MRAMQLGEGCAMPHVVILGGARRGWGARIICGRGVAREATVLEQQPSWAGTRRVSSSDGVWVDYGSHRLHHACEPAILEELKTGAWR
jgi:hypothetical protein